MSKFHRELVEGANEDCCEKRAERIPEIAYYAILSRIIIMWKVPIHSFLTFLSLETANY